LAIFGGTPIRRHPWPQWPQATKRTEQYLLDVLFSGRWSIGGKYNGKPLYARRFGESFARYHNVSYCVPTINGSAALVIALEALGVQPGDEVLVPGLAWVSCASSVTRIGAIPVLVDIDPDTLCMSVEAARNAISSRTKAIMLVHSYCTVADLDSFVELSTETHVPLLEDCSQAHGATWKERRVGSFGKIGIFSMGQSKILSCGEGGVAITDDADLYDRMEQFHGDGYRYKSSPPVIGEGELEEVGAVQGHNFCMSEFHAAILLDQLDYLDQQNRHREHNGEYLRKLCLEIGHVKPLYRHPNIDTRCTARSAGRSRRMLSPCIDIQTLTPSLTFGFVCVSI
jgi:dTDP-4-amino-4,6-dideoxygalactose transaminase